MDDVLRGKILPKDVQIFSSKLREYKVMIEEELTSISHDLEQRVDKNYGKFSRISMEAYTHILMRGGKRIRGALTLLGYEMSGGTDVQKILRAACAVEMLQAYVLIIDDINDRSYMRRGGKSAHVLMAEYYTKQQYGNDAYHFGESIAINAALAGSHMAQMTMMTLSVEHDIVLRAMSILNEGIIIAAQGQFNDLFNQVHQRIDESDVEHVLEWKTAHYTFLNPLQVGMVLASATEADVEAIKPYALHAGKAFQISDDVMGIFGEETALGKDPLDDMREGKMTLLTIYALKNASQADKVFLWRMLGNSDITSEEFIQCKDVLVRCHAFSYAQKKALYHAEKAAEALEKESGRWDENGVSFLKGLLQSVVKYKA